MVIYTNESPDLLVLSDEVILTSEANGFPHSFRKQMKLKLVNRDLALVIYTNESPDLLVLSDEVILTSEANGLPHSFRKQMKLKTCK